MISIREDQNTYIIDFFHDEDWQGFEDIFSKLEYNFDAEIKEKIEGPDSRVWHFSINGLPFTLHNNPYGNYLQAINSNSINYIKQNIKKLEYLFN